MLKQVALFACLAAGFVPGMHAQAIPTASKAADLQVGGSGVFVQPDYGTTWFKGLGAYATLDLRSHWGLMLDLHQAYGPGFLRERTYEVGGRYVRHYGRLHPYAKVMIGRGVFNFAAYPNDPTISSGSLAYNMFAVGGGADYTLRRSINLRADAEYQQWASGTGTFPNGLSPLVLSLGAAYHFH